MASKAVPFVSFDDMAFGFGFFRAGVLEDYRPGPFGPLTDEYVALCLKDASNCERGLSLLRYHFEWPDADNAVIERIHSFTLLLKREVPKPSRAWISFRDAYDRFFPVIHAIAWCPLERSEPFDLGPFSAVAGRAPLPTAWDPSADSRPVC